MAGTNTITNQMDQGAQVLGVPLVLPDNGIQDITKVLRVILALSEVDTQNLINSGESYEVLVKRLDFYRQNLQDVATKIREVTHYV